MSIGQSVLHKSTICLDTDFNTDANLSPGYYIGLDNTAHEEAIPENIRLIPLERLVQQYIIIGLKYSLGAGINQSGQWQDDMVDRDSIL